jgi:hypothetical protein
VGGWLVSSSIKPIVPPIIVTEPGDVYFFASVEEAERALEPEDVLNGSVSAFDASGTPLSLSVRSERRKVLGVIPVNIPMVRLDMPVTDRAPATQELARILANYVKRSGNDARVQDLALRQLIEVAATTSAKRVTWAGRLIRRLRRA